MNERTIATTEAISLVRGTVSIEGAHCKGLDMLMDWQLLQVAQWIGEGKSDDFVSRAIQDLWGQCSDFSFESLLSAINDFRRRLFSSPDAVGMQIDFSFDPLAENAALVRKLWQEREYWAERIKQGDALAIHLEKSDRINRLLSEAISNHAVIQAKLNQQGPSKGKQGNGNTIVHVNEFKVLIGEMRSERTIDLIEAMKSELRAKAKQIDKPKQLQ